MTNLQKTAGEVAKGFEGLSQEWTLNISGSELSDSERLDAFSRFCLANQDELNHLNSTALQIAKECKERIIKHRIPAQKKGEDSKQASDQTKEIPKERPLPSKSNEPFSFPAMLDAQSGATKSAYTLRHKLTGLSREPLADFDSKYEFIYNPSGRNNNCGPTSMIYAMVQALQLHPEAIKIESLNTALDAISQGGDYLIPKGTNLKELQLGVEWLREFFYTPDLSVLHKALKQEKTTYYPVMSAMRSLLRYSFIQQCEESRLRQAADPNNDKLMDLSFMKGIILDDEFSNVDLTIGKEWIQQALIRFGINIPFFNLYQETRIEAGKRVGRNIATGNYEMSQVIDTDTQVPLMNDLAIFLKTGHFHVLSGHRIPRVT